ncbi:MAG TPA: alpha-amylase/4-alpha-glucanotransferase domain-containing protein, partial [Candidatus Lokiarchaeia archaeon]
RWYEAYHDEDKIKKDDIMIDRFKRSMIRLRFLRKDVPLSQLQADKYVEFGNFAEGEFKVTKNEKFGTSTVIEFEMEGNVKDTDSNEEIPCSIAKKVEIEENNVIVTIKGEFKENAENGIVLKRIVEGLRIGIDVPFFFNGEPKEFQWICYEMELKTDEEKDLLSPFEYEGTYFKAYDKTYDLNFELMSSSNTEPLKICKFPIIAYAYTDEGYKRIYQGINTTFLVGLAKNFTFNLIMKIY